MKRAKLVNEIFDKMEKGHINLYHSISKKEFEKKKNEFIKIVDKLDYLHFIAGLLRLVALFKEAHTTINTTFKNDQLNVDIEFLQGGFYVLNKDKKYCEEITHINGHPINDVIDKLKQLVCYEVEEWLNHELCYLLRNVSYLKMIDMQNKNENQIEFTLKNKKKVVVTDLINFNKEDNYSFKILPNNILYVDYNLCENQEGYPFSKFVEDIQKTCKNLPKECIVDVRDNEGGSDALIYPLLEWLEDNKIKCFVLINEGTFSSGVDNVTFMKYCLNATTFGRPAGQSGYSYGEVSYELIDDILIGYSTKLFNYTKLKIKTKAKEFPVKIHIYDDLKAVQPDILVDNHPQDLINGVDTQLEAVKKYIEKDLNLSLNC